MGLLGEARSAPSQPEVMIMKKWRQMHNSTRETPSAARAARGSRGSPRAGGGGHIDPLATDHAAGCGRGGLPRLGAGVRAPRHAAWFLGCGRSVPGRRAGGIAEPVQLAR